MDIFKKASMDMFKKEVVIDMFSSFIFQSKPGFNRYIWEKLGFHGGRGLYRYVQFLYLSIWTWFFRVQNGMHLGETGFFFYRLEQIQDEEGQEEGSLAIDNFNSCINCVRSFVMTYSQSCRYRALWAQRAFTALIRINKVKKSL